MTTRSRTQRHQRIQQRRRRAFIVFAALSLAAMAAILTTHAVLDGGTSADAREPSGTVSGAASSAAESTSAPTPTPTPTPTPLTAAEELLLTTDDPNACAVSFAGDGIDLAPMLQTVGQRYAALPIPDLAGSVFAGWYTSPADASSFAVPARVNGADLVSCTDRELTLYGAFQTAEAAAAVDVGVPILMYHQFTTRPEGEDGWLKGNYAYIEDVRQHWDHIATTGFYLPTWDELDAFIDGRLVLPERSVIITDDDADATWFDLAVPIADEDRLLTTSFVITSARQEATPSVWVQQRSHTHDMHTAGDNGAGRMVNWTAEQITADLEQSATILGAKEVIAYPFGHHDERSKAGVAAAGFDLAVTIEHGYVHVGADKLALPRVRINYGTTLDDLIALIG